MFRLGKSSLANRKGVDPRLIEISDRAIEISTIDFGHGPVSGLRTPEIQEALYLDGKSKCDGYQNKSYHQTGLALDFYAYVDGGASWKPEHLAMVGAAFLQAANELGYKLTWGGFFKSFTDMPHVQLAED